MNIHSDFINSLRLMLKDESNSLLSAIAEVPPVSVRFNPIKFRGKPDELLEIDEQVAWSEYGFYLKKRPSFTFDPLFHSGLYYVQEASSMFIEYVVSQLFNKPVHCLDLCASPGGKSISMLSALPEGSFLTVNEIIRQRANILSETMIKYGNPNILVTNNEPKNFNNIQNFFDLILVDAPCSGEGMFRKDEVAIKEWSTDNVIMCTVRQKNILSDIWPSLKPGGVLIYSTCTYNITENEENALWTANELGADFVKIETESKWGISPSFNAMGYAYRFFPHKTKGEGLYVTVLRKSSNEKKPDQLPIIININQLNLNQEPASFGYNKKSKKYSSIFIKDYSNFSKYLKNPDFFNYIQEGNRILAIPKKHTDIMLSLRETLNVISMGIELGEIKGKDFIPCHALAMSSELNRDMFVTKELTYNNAIAYLRREAINIPDAPKGIILLTYKNEPLGFVKNIGNRANNLYPDKWRIRT